MFSKYTINNGSQFAANTHIYADSGIRVVLKILLEGFTGEVQNAMKTQSFPSNGSTLNDKVKCPSLEEVGANPGYLKYYISEGTIYPIFGTNQTQFNNLAIYKTSSGGGNVIYWTRSRATYDSKGLCIYCVNTNGRYESILYYQYYHVIACIRF